MYLIDGNNVIGQRVGWHRDKPAARKRLMDELAHLSLVRRIRLAVVFDGRPDPAFPDGTSFRGVRIYYAARGSDADQRIVELVEATTNRHNLTVVTSDGRLTEQVRVRGVKVIRSGAFRRWLEESLDVTPSGEDLRVREDQMGQWMRYFGVDGDEGEGEDEDDDDDIDWR